MDLGGWGISGRRETMIRICMKNYFHRIFFLSVLSDSIPEDHSQTFNKHQLQTVSPHIPQLHLLWISDYFSQPSSSNLKMSIPQIQQAYCSNISLICQRIRQPACLQSLCSPNIVPDRTDFPANLLTSSYGSHGSFPSTPSPSICCFVLFLKSSRHPSSPNPEAFISRMTMKATLHLSYCS